jgi:hypothetical protein
MSIFEIRSQFRALESAMKTYLQEKGIPLEWVHFQFSNNMSELEGSASSFEALKPKGFMVRPTVSDIEKIVALHEAVYDFTTTNRLEGFKTFATHRNCISAMTWEDLASGMNAQFERLGSKARVDMSVFRNR